MTRPRLLTIRVPIADGTGQVVTVRGREAWALKALMAAGERACTPIDHPGPRWSGYVHDRRRLGINIETVHEPHSESFPGTHARFVVRSGVEVVDNAEAAA